MEKETQARISGMDKVSEIETAKYLAGRITSSCLPCSLADLIGSTKEQLQRMRDPDAAILIWNTIVFGEFYLDALCRQYEKFLPIKKMH